MILKLRQMGQPRQAARQMRHLKPVLRFGFESGGQFDVASEKGASTLQPIRRELKKDSLMKTAR